MGLGCNKASLFSTVSFHLAADWDLSFFLLCGGSQGACGLGDGSPQEWLSGFNDIARGGCVTSVLGPVWSRRLPIEWAIIFRTMGLESVTRNSRAGFIAEGAQDVDQWP